MSPYIDAVRNQAVQRAQTIGHNQAASPVEIKLSLRTALSVEKRANPGGNGPGVPLANIDAARHIIQVHRGKKPILEIACTKNERPTLINFCRRHEVEIMKEDFNPLMANTEQGQDEDKVVELNLRQCKRMMIEWAKAAHNIRSVHTREYYRRFLIKMAGIETTEYEWPRNIMDVGIDCTDGKDAQPQIDLVMQDGSIFDEVSLQTGFKPMTITCKKKKQTEIRDQG